MRHTRAIFGLCLLLAACDQRPATGPSVHLVATPGCASDWTKCTDNAELVRDYGEWKQVPGLCQRATEIKSQTGAPQWLDRPFSATLPGNIYVSSGKAVAIAPDVAFVSADRVSHAKVVCEFDLKQHAVTSLYIVPL
ncbi:MAG TPA: hypothetical protein VJ476_15045 [Rhizomicrobium sp.]|nr:hypothetical protein [Rhizomicrobium sp.]